VLPRARDDRFRELENGLFQFACHPKVPCFNECCRRLDLVLTPYDLLRLRQALGISSDEFLDRYALVEPGQNGWTQARLKMNEDPEKTCPFLADQGCAVYEHRPGACRCYPLGRATRGGRAGGPLEEAFFLVKETHCQGFAQGPAWNPADWIEDQGLAPYLEFSDLFLPLITRQPMDSDPKVLEQKARVFFAACYNLEKFREFVLKSRLRHLFDLSPELLAQIAESELDLLRFAFKWVGFSVFGDPVLKLAAGAGAPG
jgi:Fe-S-cluster containining protein